MTPPHRALVGATLWGASWALGVLVLLGPRLPAGVDPVGVLAVGATGFLVGGGLHGALVWVYRQRDLTELGVGGLGLLSQGMAAGIFHVLGTAWITFRLALMQGSSFLSGFPGTVDLIAVLVGLFALPVWAFFAAVARLASGAERHTLFLAADPATVPVLFALLRYASRGIG